MDPCVERDSIFAALNTELSPSIQPTRAQAPLEIVTRLRFANFYLPQQHIVLRYKGIKGKMVYSYDLVHQRDRTTYWRIGYKCLAAVTLGIL